MEFLGELLVGLLQVFGELLLQFIFEALAELGVRKARNTFPKSSPPHPILAGLGYALLGAALGALSVWIWPASFVQSTWGRLLGLCVVPVLAGLAMSAIGAWRQRRDQELIRLDRFGYAFVFAFAMALVRFAWARP